MSFPTVFGADYMAEGSGSTPGGWMGGSPDAAKEPQPRRFGPENKKVAWSRRVVGTLKRERQEVSSQMRKAVDLATGSTPWWKTRPTWKIATTMNYCSTVPLTWTAILCDAKPTVSYSSQDRRKQRRADIATSAWNQAYQRYHWEKKIHDAVLVSRVMKKAYLSLRPDSMGDQVKPSLRVVLGSQVWLDRNASGIDDAEIVLYEYRESYGSLCSRFENLRGKLRRKYDQPNDPQDPGSQSVTVPPTSYNMSDVQTGGATYYNQPYAATPNPPDGLGGSSGILVREFWTRPHRTIEVDEVQFLTSGEPATIPKMYETIKPEHEEPLRRVVTEGDVIYELPESLVAAMHEAADNGGIQILSDEPALQCVKHKVKYPLYPDGRLMTIVDEDIEADDRMNPLGYFPFAEINANSDPAGGVYGPSDVDLIADVYEQLVRMVSLVMDTANLTGNAVWRIPIGAEISNDDITNAPGAIQREDITCLKYGKREAPPDLPAYVINHIKFLKEEIKELSGLSDMMTGKMPPKMQVSTETMTLGQEASGVRFRDALADLSSCMRTLGEHFLEFMARFYTSPVIVQIKNDAGVEEPVPMLGAYLTDPFVVEAKAGSRQPSGPSARLRTLLDMKNSQIPMPLEVVYNLLEEIGAIPSATAIMREVETLKKDPSQTWKLLGIPMPGQQKPQQSKKPGSKRANKQAHG
jgi:hypothetical protein